MDKVKFDKDQFCDSRLIHYANKEYECISSDKDSYFIRMEGCPKGKNWCTRFPKECENNLFKFVN